jgi:hypothetical protein
MENSEGKSTKTTVAKVNNYEIVVIENGERYVPIRPICEALGIDFSVQLKKLKDHPIFGSTVVMNTTVGGDGKEREMATILFKFVFGWLGQIDPRKVREEVREPLIRYQLECYNALYNHFTRFADFIQQKQQLIEEQLVIVEEAKNNFKNAKSVLDDANTRLNTIRKLTLNDYDAEKRQLKLFTQNEMEG